MKPHATRGPLPTVDPFRTPRQTQAEGDCMPLSYPSRYKVGESPIKRLLRPVRRALWKVVGQFTIPRQRALQGVYNELAGIKGALAALESQLSRTGPGTDAGEDTFKPSKLKPGGVLALETINPGSLHAMNNAFYLDPSYVRPIHPDTLKFMMDQAGFHPLKVMFRAPVDAKSLLEEVPIHKGTSPARRESLEVLNRNLHRLNGLLYGYQDYAVIGWRPNPESKS